MDQLRVLCAAGMTKVGTCAGFIGWRLKAWLHARRGEPLDGALFRIAHFGTAAAGEGFMATAVATRGRNALQSRGCVPVEGYHRQENEGDHSELSTVEKSA